MTFDPIIFVCSVVALTVAFIVHEYAHALAAYTLGDPTPKYEGRLSFNPLIHVDPAGSLVMLVTMMVPGCPVLGWARPVKVDRDNLKSGHLDVALVAAAGPFVNFVVAFLCGVAGYTPLGQFKLTGVLLLCLIKANLGFGLFNCYPWPPLDGWKMLTGIVPRNLGDTMFRLECQAGLYSLLVLLLASPILVSPVITPIFFSLFQILNHGIHF